MDAIIIAAIVFLSFVGSAFLVHSRILLREETHLHAIIESTAWKAANYAGKLISPEGQLLGKDLENVRRGFEGFQVIHSEVGSLSLFHQAGGELLGLLHVAGDSGEIPPKPHQTIPPQEADEAATALGTGTSRLSLEKSRSPVVYAPVFSATGKVSGVVRVEAADMGLPPLWLDLGGSLQIGLIGALIASMTGFFVYSSNGRFQTAYRKLAVAEKRLRDVTEAAGEFIWEVNTQGKYTYISDRATEILGYAPEEMLGHHPFEYVHPEDLEAVKMKSDEIVSQAIPFRDFEERMIKKDGSTIWAAVNGVPVKDDSGLFGGYRGATLEITERKLNEKALIREKEAAQSAAIAKHQFLAMMSHEIRTPLNSVIGFAETLSCSDLKPDQRQQLEMIQRSGDALLELLDDILLFSRAESGNLTFSPEPTRIRDFIERVVELHAQAAKTKMIGLSFHVADLVPEGLMLDQMRMRQIMLNLIGNAVKFTSEGRVAVSVGGRPGEDGTFQLEVAVEDTGVGILQEKFESLFQPFIQADSSTTRKFGGSGLGLAICRRLADLMHGKIWIESSSPKGSRFLFSCSCKAVEAPEIEKRSAHAHLPGVSDLGLRVLITEDNPTNSRLLQLILQSLGCESDTAFNGLEALEKHENAPYDVILMDMQMPVMDGISATVEIRELERRNPALSRVEIVALTANAMSGDRERCLAAGMDNYLSKPIRKPELEKALREVAGGKAGNR